MRKLLAVLLSMTLVLSVTAFAKDTGELEKVLLSVKERIAATDDYETFQSSEHEVGGGITYSFNWYTDTDEQYKSMDVNVTSDGMIISYNRYDGKIEPAEKVNLNRPDNDTALSAAYELIKKLNPDTYDKISLEINARSSTLYADGYSFSVTHVENGIPVDGDTGYLNITEDLSEITDFYMSYTNAVSYENPEKAIELSAAKAAYAEKIGMELTYKTEYDGRKRTAYLSYSPKETHTYIDAFSGEAVTPIRYFGRYYASGSTNEAAMAEDKAMDRGFSTAEIAEIDKVSGLLTKEQAEEKVRAVKAFALPKNAEITSSACRRDYYDENKYYYSLRFYDGEDYYANATVDAKTGEILSWNGDLSKDKTTLKATEAEKLADEAAKLLASNYIKDYKKDEPEELSDDAICASFSYVRQANGIPYPDNRIYISVSLVTGKVVSYGITHYDIELPKPENIIDAETASAKLFEQVNYELSYIPCLASEKSERPDKSVLVYKLSDGDTELDAFTGKQRHPYEEVKIPEYTDISGHYAENAIKTLARFNIGFAEEEFKPDEEITQKDMIALLNSAVENRDGAIIYKSFPYDSAYIAANRNGILNEGEESPESSVTREMAAVYFIRAINLEEVASLSGIYVTPYTDVTENIGYIAILSGMKVVSGDGEGRFNPSAKLTRGAAAVMIYNYLNR